MLSTRSACVFLLLLAIAAPGTAQRGGRGERYESAEGRFRATFPDRTSKPEVKELAVGGGQIIMVTTVRSDGPGMTSCAVTYADYPDSYKDVAAKTILDGVRDGLVGKDGKLASESETTLGEGGDRITGREIRIVAGQKVIRARVFLVGIRLYQVMVTGAREAVGLKAADEFLKSFEITK